MTDQDRITQLEASHAAMREFIASTPHKPKCHLQQDRPFSEQRRKEFDAKGCDCGRDQALSTDAGKSLIDRLQAVEAERDLLIQMLDHVGYPEVSRRQLRELLQPAQKEQP